MKKRLLALTLCVLMVTVSFSGCKKQKEVKKEEEASSSEMTSSIAEPVNKNIINPLTGIQDMDPSLKDRKPVAIMIDNINVAQAYQTGLNNTDIIYETEVEGGITRLMAVAKNAEAINRIGPIRSSRYPYIDLALGHDANYFHCGQDGTYALPHLADIKHVSVGTNYYAERIKNGLASEHTLYSYGNLLWKAESEKLKSTTTSKTDAWQNFAGEDESISFAGNVANTVNVPFSAPNIFTYDATTGLYTRNSKTAVRKDYVTGELVTTKNLFILNTTIVFYPDKKHRQVYLEGGTGWYAVNGTYTQITWKKGRMNDSMKFYDASGNPLKVNQGRSWVILVNNGVTVPTFQ